MAAHQHNDYSRALGDLFDRAPKTVLASVVVSLLTCGGDMIDDTDGLREAFTAEWRALHANGIVQQRPPAV